MRAMFSLILAITFSSECNAQVSGTTYSEALRTKSANLVFVYNNVFGFTEQKPNGVEGLLVDLMDEFAEYVLEEKGIELQHKFKYTDDDFSKFMNEVRIGKGGVFGLGNVSIKEERKIDFEFSPPYLDNISLLVTHSSVPTLLNVEELTKSFSQMKGVSITNSTNDQRLKELGESYLPSLEIEYFKSGNQLLRKVVQDQNSFAVIDLNFYVEALLTRQPIKRHSVFDQKDVPFGIVMPKGSGWAPVLKEFFNSGFITSTTYSQIISENLGSSALRLIEAVKEQ